MFVISSYVKLNHELKNWVHPRSQNGKFFGLLILTFAYQKRFMERSVSQQNAFRYQTHYSQKEAKRMNAHKKCDHHGFFRGVTILVALGTLAATCLSISAKPQAKAAGRIPTKENPKKAPSEKLVDAEYAIRGFKEGQQKVKVIVNLEEPTRMLTNMNWRSKKSLKQLHEEVSARQAEVLSSLPAAEFTLRRRFENQAAFSAEVTPKALDRLLSHPRVNSIEPVYPLELHLAQGIPLINGTVYRSTYNGQGVAIAICDSGVDYTHPKLGGGGFPNSKVIGGYDTGDDDPDPTPSGEAHGTCCAGIAAGDMGTMNDYIGGVAPAAKLYSLKIEDSLGYIYSDYAIAAWDWCVSHKDDDPCCPILVISNSYGGGRYFGVCDSSESAYSTAANNAVAAGITLLVSSGNNGYCDSISRPGCLGNTISVGAVYDAAFGTYSPCVSSGSCATKYSTSGCSTGYYATDYTDADMVTSYSNTASFLDILAPSNQAYTTDMVGADGYSSGDYYDSFGGTSAACPYAAGTVACIQSAAKAILGSYLSPSETRDVLTQTGDDITDTKVNITKPRINLAQAIASLGPQPPVAYDAVVQTAADTPVNVALVATDDADPDPPAALTYSIRSLPTHGSLSDPFAGAISFVPYELGGYSNIVTYTPDPEYEGLDSFTFAADDGGTEPNGGTSNVATLTVTVGLTCCTTVVASYPYCQSFEAGFEDWENVAEDDFDWTRHSGSTPSSGTGPSSAYDRTYYAYTEASGYNNMAAILEGPCFDLRSACNPQLSFWYHMYGSSMGTLSVEITDDCSTWTSIWSRSGNQGSYWQQAVVDLSAYAGSTINIRFKGVTGSSYTSDMAIDYICVNTTEQLRITGQDFSSSGYEAGPFVPYCGDYTLTNDCAGRLGWSVEVPSWLRVSPASGTLLQQGDFANVFVCLADDVNDLDPNLYTGEIVFHNQASGNSQARQANLEVMNLMGHTQVTDSVGEPYDLNMPYGDAIVGLFHTEQITICNTDPDPRHEVVIQSIVLGHYEDFNDGQAQNWCEHANGQWEIQSGDYHVLPPSSSYAQSLYCCMRWTDFDVQARIWRIGNTGSSTAARLIFRANDEFSLPDATGSAYAVHVYGTGYFRVARYISGSYYSIHYGYSTYLNTGTNSNIVTVVTKGPTIRARNVII